GANRDGNRRGQEGQNRDGGNRDGNRRSQDGASRDGSRQGRDGANRDGNRRGQEGQNRDGANRDGSRRSQDGQNRDNRQGRDGAGRDGMGRANRDGAGRRTQDGGDRSGYNRRGQDGQGAGAAGRSYRDGAGRDGSRSYGTRDGGAGRDAGRGSQGGFRRDGGAGRDGGFNRDGAGQGQNRDGAGRRGQDAGRRRSSDGAMRGEGIKEDAAFRQGKNDRKSRQERNKQENRERSFHQEKAIKTPVKQQAKPKEAPEEKIKLLVLPETISIKELADKMSVQPSALLKKLLLAGTIVNLNQEIDYEMAEQIALEYDIICEKEEKVDVIAELLKEDEEDESLMQKRPPVVCVMGHVDHGKTSLLDAIRKTNVIAHEAGGITQHIGAYTVEIDGRQITFLDTPGHEAFTAMRMRGAQATDIAILVVAADDGVMPQTVEAINHAKAANISIIVAINKIDKPGANVERVKQELTEHGLVAESWGGSTIMVPVSAHTGEGIEELLEMVLLDADINELKANPERKARGIVIEAKLDKGRGPVMTVLVQKGTLHVGENVAVGEHYGKVRSMINDKGRRVDSAGPSVPVEIAGMNGVPNAGEIFIAMDNEKDARTFAETFIAEGRKKLIEGTKAKMSLDDLYSQIKAGDVKELDIVVKADVQGSVEAVRQSLEKLSNDEVIVKVIHGGVGAINESDVTLASASNAIVIGFNVKPDNQAKDIAQTEHVDLRLYSVIYNAIADVELAMKGMLDPIFEERVIGHGEVRQTFRASGVGTIAGSYVLDGIFQRGCKCRITRGKDQIFDGELASLKRFKDDVKEVRAGYECGCVFEKFNDLQEGDLIEAYAMVEVPRV
ncbi:MAG: translation initiation factor IF-2, partial [Lachnospiraceae bacterium]|nr:translation initiation factor IF-2 [Lachnospiraceae bacterium]